MIIDISEEKTITEYRVQFKTARDDQEWLDYMVDGEFDTYDAAVAYTKYYDRKGTKLLNEVMPDRGYRVVETTTIIKYSPAFTVKLNETKQ